MDSCLVDLKEMTLNFYFYLKGKIVQTRCTCTRAVFILVLLRLVILVNLAAS